MSRGFHSENAQGINSDVFKWEKNMYVYVVYDSRYDYLCIQENRYYRLITCFSYVLIISFDC